MSVEQVLFWAFGACIVLGATLVIAARSAVNSAMALVATFFFLAGIYLLLWAPTLAVLQVLVYAGAIMVLFLFVIMLLSLSETESQGGRMTLSRILGGAAAVALLWALESTLLRIAPVSRSTATAPSPDFGSLKSLGILLYTQYLLPFEVVSLLLLVAIVGAVVVAKSRI
jgi:NADH-quinone oxidoreductase subunit J